MVWLKIVAVPSEHGSLERNLGCGKAPLKILELLKKKSVQKFETDFVEVDKSNFEETDKRIFEKALKLFSKKEQCIFLGGDHSITYALFKAFSKNFGSENSFLIVFDAHVDAAQFFKPVSHEDMNKVLVEEGFLKKENLLLVAVRKVFKIEQCFLKKNKVKVIEMKKVQESFGNAIDEFEDFLDNAKNLYVSIDADVFDPKIAPGTGVTEKNGLSEENFFKLFEKALFSEKLNAVDLTEVNPLKDFKQKTLNLALKIVEKTLHEWKK